MFKKIWLKEIKKKYKEHKSTLFTYNVSRFHNNMLNL